MARFTTALLAATLACAPSTEDPSALTAELEAQFTRSAEAWTSGRLDDFMADYAQESTTTFVSGGNVERGYEWIRGHYAPLFEPGARRDSLRFERLVARPLAPGVAMVTARFILFRNDTITASGPFTLVMAKRANGWKILHDHTSSDPE